MGQCCSFFRRFHPFSNIELGANENVNAIINENSIGGEVSVPQVHSIDSLMSAPSISITGDLNNEVRGYGLALADVPVEQDRAYWEWRVKVIGKKSSSVDCMFGVSNKRNSKFYEILAESTVPAEKHGTKFMCSIPNLHDGDVIGVMVQQSELPMVQLYLNGEVQSEGQVSKFRGTVYPSVFLPPGSEMSAKFLYREEQFIHGPSRPGFGPLLAERSIM